MGLNFTGMEKNGILIRLYEQEVIFLKRVLLLLTVLLMILSALPAGADTFWKMHWNPGEYTVEFSPEEDAQITGIIEEAIEKSEGTDTRTVADQESVEAQYERFIGMFPDGNPVEYDDVDYEDIGFYKWAVGIPDSRSVSRDEAWKITLKFLIDQHLATPETLAHYYPQVSYETGSDPENPAWHIILECYDYEESDLPITAWSVSVYAHDGSICGYREVEGAG